MRKITSIGPSSRSRGRNLLARLAALMIAGGATTAYAQTGCEGANATSDAGGRSAELALRTQQETIDKAKAGAKIDPIPTFVGGTISFSHTDHDGYRLRTPVAVNDCANNPRPPVNQLLPFESQAVSASGLIELDLTKRLGLPDLFLFKTGVGIGGKHLHTDYSGTIRRPSVPDPTIGVNIANGTLSEHGAQFDFYTLMARGPTYAIVASSIGFGDTEINNAAYTSGLGTFGGGRGTTNFHDYSFQGTLGHVFTLSSHDKRRVLLDLSGGLLYSHYTRDAFIDTKGVSFSDAETEEFSGKLEAKLAFQHLIGDGAFTPYVKGGVKHRFEYDSTVTVTNPGTGVCIVGGVLTNPCPLPFTRTYDLTSDNTFWRVAGGLSMALGGDKQTGIVEIFYEGSGDSREIGAKAQYVVKLH